jgi:hypothetical protein
VPLFAATKALRDGIGEPCPPCDRADADSTLATLLKALGKRAFTRAWAEGRGITWEEAVQEALGTREAH